MSLNCYCDSGDGDWWYYPPHDYQTLDTKRGRRCCLCHTLIKRGSLCGKFVRERSPASIIEERIHGDEVPMSPLWMCETCTDFYYSLDEQGYCVNLGDGDTRDDLVQQLAER